MNLSDHQQWGMELRRERDPFHPLLALQRQACCCLFISMARNCGYAHERGPLRVLGMLSGVGHVPDMKLGFQMPLFNGDE